MADTRVQLEVAGWLRSNWLPQRFGQKFTQRKYSLTSGGEFSFDAISADGRVVVTISTSEARTAGGRRGSGKLQKTRADALFLLLSGAESQVLVFTEPDMFELCLQEQEKGRLPQHLQLLHAVLPPDLQAKLSLARKASSDEVLPTQPV